MSRTSDPPDIVIRQGAYLPHWTRERATYAVTFRLADSLPQTVLDAWTMEREEILAAAVKQRRPLSVSEEERLGTLHSERVEAYLDAGHGACRLRDPRAAELVCDEFRHFDCSRYRLHAWCVMPNHVHAVIEPVEPHTLPAIMHSWKSYTAKVANQVLGRTGAFWQPEYYDHHIRDAAEFDHAVQYVADNPEKAGLKAWPWVYVARATCP